MLVRNGGAVEGGSWTTQRLRLGRDDEDRIKEEESTKCRRDQDVKINQGKQEKGRRANKNKIKRKA